MVCCLDRFNHLVHALLRLPLFPLFTPLPLRALPSPPPAQHPRSVPEPLAPSGAVLEREVAAEGGSRSAPAPVLLPNVYVSRGVVHATGGLLLPAMGVEAGRLIQPSVVEGELR